MYDIYCPHCGEPWEHDTLHDVEGMSYLQAGKAFTVQGCTIFKILRQRIEGTGSICKADQVVSDTDLAAINGAHEMSDYPEEWDYDLAFAIYNRGDV
jgi:hypothetical protein